MLSRYWFTFVHTRFLIYNICWEDSDVDRTLLELDPESDILMISSAGCNALNYLLDDPAHVDCVDVNPRQNALLCLKMALIRNSDHPTFFRFFGDGRHPDHKTVYAGIRSQLPDYARSFWDKRIDYFHPDGRGFFYQGGAGVFARFLNHFFRKHDRRQMLLKLLKEPFAEHRQELFASIERELFSGLRALVWKQPALLALAGIPDQQRNAIGDMDAFMKEALRNIFVHQDPGVNHYWNAYLNGGYEDGCCPDYLKSDHFDTLKQRVERLSVHTGALNKKLRDSKRVYSHLILLDHMDWLAERDPDVLADTWHGILKRTRPGSRILFRTAFRDIGFLPDFVRDHADLQEIDPRFIAMNDKVGTYTGTWMAEVV